MDRRQILEEKYKLLCCLNSYNKSSIIGEKISIKDFGDGTIIDQSANSTLIQFTSNKYDFKSLPGKSFYIDVNKEEIEKKIAILDRQLDEIPTISSTIKELVDSLNVWEKYEQYYISELIPSLMDGSVKNPLPKEKELIEKLKDMMSEADWKNLPSIALSIKKGEIPIYCDNKESDEEKIIKEKCENNFKHERLIITKQIIENAIILQKLDLLFKSDYLNARKYKDNNINQKIFEEARVAFLKKWFKDNSSFTPDNEQLSAIGALEQNVQVVARAGSGKTSTIVNRAKFLIDHCHVEPSSILMLAFNRKAAEEMKKRVKENITINSQKNERMPHVMTFHAMAHSIVNPNAELIFNDDEEDVLYQFVQDIITEELQKEEFQTRVRTVMLEHFKGNWWKIERGGYNLPKEEMLKYRREMSLFSLRGDFVKSEEDRLLANLLYEHGIDNYHYSKTLDIPRGNGRVFDFCIRPKNSKPIIIDLNKKYDSWLLNFINKSACYIQLDVTDFDKGEEHIISLLKTIMNQYDLPFERLSDDEIWEKIKKRSIDTFTEAVTSFIGRTRKENLSPKELERKVTKHTTTSHVEKMFLDIVVDIYYLYIEKLETEHKDDFDGLMQHAINLVRNGCETFDRSFNKGKLTNITHILIDEYQDFSLLFDSFIEAIKTHCPNASLFCVGDDWQAINGFAGSKVDYFKSFETRFNDTRVYSILTNYRSKQEIVNLGTSLMDESQINKIKANNANNKGIIKVGYYEDLISSDSENLNIRDNERVALLRLIYDAMKRDRKIAILSRTNDDGIKNLIDTLKRELSLPMEKRHYFGKWVFNNTFSEDCIDQYTVHKYKGKEKSIVVITDAIENYFPLIHPNWIFQRIFGDTIEKIIDDEKRLFYVALTRAIDELIILTNKGKVSQFLLQVKSLNENNIIDLEWSQYKAIQIGEVNGRIEISNEHPEQSAPTYRIRSHLKRDGYSFNSNSRKWSKAVKEEEMNYEDVFLKEWAYLADGVIVSFYVNDDCLETYLIKEGTPHKIEN